jgi:hypothetical protein
MNRVFLTLFTLIGLFLSLLVGCSGTESPNGIRPPGDDTSPPAAVTDLVLAWSVDNGEVSLEWTAPRDDSPSERVAGYEIRIEYTDGYVPADFWRTASAIVDPPAPADPGLLQTYLIDDPRRARDLYVGIRAIDEAGNRSTALESAMIHVTGFTFSATCVDVFSGSPVEGLSATLSTGEAWVYTTDAAGGFSHQGELDGGVTHVDIRSGALAATWHTMNQSFTLEDDSVHTFFMIPVETVGASWAPNLLALFNRLVSTLPYAAETAGSSGTTENSEPTSKTETVGTAAATLSAAAPAPRILAKWRHRPVACYIPPFVNTNGVDYEAQAKLAATRWMEKTGEPLFVFVDSPPDTGVVVAYKSRSEMGGGIAFTRHHPGADRHPVMDEIWIIDEATNPLVIYKVFLHEFGHTIPLGHTDDREFIMFVAQPLPGDISDDEARVVQLLESLPVRIDMSIYDENSP